MIDISHSYVYGWEAAIRGMRNPMNSWERSDSWIDGEIGYVGNNDLNLMEKLAKAGDDHGKFLRMITVTCDIVAPLYWWKEFDTYKVGTVANSCSTMHKIHDKDFTLDDFSHEHMESDSLELLKEIIHTLNVYREAYINHVYDDPKIPWWQMIQLLPSSYNQKRTVQMNYQVLKHIYKAREGHKLDEWNGFRSWCRTLPYFLKVTGSD